MEFTMTVGTKKLTFLELLSNSFPTPGVSSIRDPEVLIRGFEMMNFQRLRTSIITATSTPVA
jgi:hypothetical protein